METITFYSYKGGTGRSMAIVHLAYILADIGHKVFVLDFDLEAPGLHLKFGATPKNGKLMGLVDLLCHYRKSDKDIPLDKKLPVDMDNYVSRVSNNIWLLPAGNAPSPEYLHALTMAGISGFFKETDEFGNVVAIPLFLRLKDRIEREYAPDYLLIDSRTGVSEFNTIGLRILPDTVVGLANSNIENISGLRRILRSALHASRPVSRPDVRVLAVLTRIPEMSLENESQLLENTRNELNGDDGGHVSLGLEEVMCLHSEPDMQIVENLRIGIDVTAGDSVLLRDYLKLFFRLGMDKGRISPEQQRVLQNIAWADRDPAMRELLADNRAMRGESQRAPVHIARRLDARGDSVGNVVSIQYQMKGGFYDRLLKGVTSKLFDRCNEINYDNWELLPVHIRDGIVDFCKDIYYLTENRNHLVDIVQFGWCRTFEFVFYPAIEENIGLNSLSALGELLTRRCEISVGILGDTPAASEASRQLGYVLPPSRLVAMTKDDALSDWLKRGTPAEPRLIICDHVILEAVRGRFPECPPASTLLFSNPIPVGLVYPREDRIWRKKIVHAIAEAIIDFNRLPYFRWGGIEQEFKSKGLDALAADLFLKSLLMDLPLEYAFKWWESVAPLGINQIEVEKP